eukprot:1152419-Pelagomonas_calceolata.AAC.1
MLARWVHSTAHSTSPRHHGCTVSSANPRRAALLPLWGSLGVNSWARGGGEREKESPGVQEHGRHPLDSKETELMGNWNVVSHAPGCPASPSPSLHRQAPSNPPLEKLP